jgi:hypothetical protein
MPRGDQTGPAGKGPKQGPTQGVPSRDGRGMGQGRGGRCGGSGGRRGGSGARRGGLGPLQK